MSLILKGINLPEEGTLTFRITRYGKAYEITNNNYYIKGTEIEAIQIPKDHGRIIDEKELKTKIHDVRLEGGALHGCIDKTVLHEVPTILEAEE